MTRYALALSLFLGFLLPTLQASDRAKSLASDEPAAIQSKTAPDTPPVASPTPLPGQEAVAAAVKNVGAKVDQLADDATKDQKLLAGTLKQIRRIAAIPIFGFTVGQLAASFFILLAFLAFRRFVINLLFRGLRRFAKRRKNRLNEDVLEAIERPLSVFILANGVYLAVLVLPLEAAVSSFVGNAVRAVLMGTVVWGFVRLTDLVANQIGARVGERPGSAAAGFAPLIKKTLRIFVLIVGVLMVVDNLGYNLTGLITTLGLGTAAVAFAAQDTLKNGFGAFMIVLDRPFKVGDWIQVGDTVDGNVESIGLRSTKIRTFPKTIVSVPNGVLANEPIDNWTQMPKRRVKQTLGVTYDSTAADMEGLVEDIRELLRADDGVHQDFILVNFTDFGSSSLDILVYYFTKSTAWLTHMDTRQRVNCKIMRAVHNRGLSIAFPTRTLHLEGQVASQLADVPHEDRWDLGPGRPRHHSEFSP